MPKKLMVNCGTCDARSVSEETLKAYERIILNAGSIVVTPESKDLLNRCDVTMNCGDVIELDKDVQLSSVNGSMQINSTDAAPEKRTYLEVKGSLEIGPDTQDILSKYVGINVNGSVTYPQSMSGKVPLKVNGSTTCYPDGAIVLKRTAVIDHLFTLRAKAKCYWSDKRMIFVDPQLDGAALAAKGATFSAKEMIIAQSKVESLIDQIDEKAAITIVPDDTQMVLDDLELNIAAGKKYGSKLCVLGDLEVAETAGPVLQQMQYLNVQGDVLVPAALEELLMEKLNVVSGDVHVAKGRYLKNKLSLRISRSMLEREPDGLTACNCVQVKLDGDIPEALILQRLRLEGCVKVSCTPEQETAVGEVSQDVVQITTGGDDAGMVGLLGSMLGGAKQVLDTKFINAGEYVL